MKKVGVSIPWDYLTDSIITDDSNVIRDVYGHSDGFLKTLKDLKVSHIELRHRPKHLSDAVMDKVFRQLLDYNFSITIHGDSLAKGSHLSLSEMFPWLNVINKRYIIDEPIMVTMHPVTDREMSSLHECNKDTVNFIRKMNDVIREMELPLKLALENQRVKAGSISGTSFQEVEELWKEIDCQNVGLCWDFGHGVANSLINGDRYPLFPHDSFISNVVHTHIHDIGYNGRTHWFFQENIVPIKKYIEKLKSSNYEGVYNLELSFNRFKDQKNYKEQFERSVVELWEMI